MKICPGCLKEVEDTYHYETFVNNKPKLNDYSLCEQCWEEAKQTFGKSNVPGTIECFYKTWLINHHLDKSRVRNEVKKSIHNRIFEKNAQKLMDCATVMFTFPFGLLAAVILWCIFN